MIDLTVVCGSRLKLDDDGIWTCDSSTTVSYPEEGREACFAVEDSSFWFRHRNDCILEVVSRFPPLGTVIDVGGGNGFVSRALQDAGFDVVLLEPGRKGAVQARKRGVRQVVAATLEEAGFPPGSLPGVGLFDVLEHIQDDCGFLMRLRERLTDQGRIYLTVPALPWLWSGEDEVAGHFRRYTARTLSGLLSRTHFKLEFMTAIFSLLPLPIFCFRALPRFLPLRAPRTGPWHASLRRQHHLESPLTRAFSGWMLRRELGRIRTLRSTRFGSSLLVVASKS